MAGLNMSIVDIIAQLCTTSVNILGEDLNEWFQLKPQFTDIVTDNVCGHTCIILQCVTHIAI